MFEGRIKTHFERQSESGRVKKGIYGLYWMQQAQRIEYNHALYYAIESANRLKIPLVVYVGLTLDYPDANERHYSFMLEGLKEVEAELTKRKIAFVMLEGSPEKAIEPLLLDAEFLIMDKGYLKFQRRWRESVVEKVMSEGICDCYEVESDVIVPVECASLKEEYMARTIRPKIERELHYFARDFVMPSIVCGDMPTFSLQNRIFADEYALLLSRPEMDHSVKKSSFYQGGHEAGLKMLREFSEYGLFHYDESNSPAEEYTSKMSMYLHFGQLSSLEIYLYLSQVSVSERVSAVAIKGYLEQLIIRRELAMNFVYYREGYDVFETMTNRWAYLSMALHDKDPRDIIYAVETMESGKTHDSYFNAAMQEMVKTGYMHNYMRMYWCKKIIEWSKSHKEAYLTAVYLNNKYLIDGRDGNSYVGVAWCFGLHDQGWKERPIFGKLRYMNDKGLERKFDMKQYTTRIREL